MVIRSYNIQFHNKPLSPHLAAEYSISLLFTTMQHYMEYYTTQIPRIQSGNNGKTTASLPGLLDRPGFLL